MTAAVLAPSTSDATPAAPARLRDLLETVGFAAVLLAAVSLLGDDRRWVRIDERRLPVALTRHASPQLRRGPPAFTG